MLGLKLIGMSALAPGSSGPNDPATTPYGAMDTGAQLPLRKPFPTFLTVRLASIVCPAGPVMLNNCGTESFPASPAPFRMTPVVGSVGSLLPMSTVAESFNASGWKVTVSGEVPPGMMLNDDGVTVKTDAPAGGAINICTFPVRFVLPVFLMMKALLVDHPIGTEPMLTATGDRMFGAPV